jgi:arabinan endo-1,5-alpha-L-arabinosidase
MRYIFLLLFQTLLFLNASATDTYNNPIVPRSLPDPSIIKGTDGYFYLFATEDTRNIPIMRSNDLVDWSFVGTAFSDATRPTFEPNGGLWAPDINYINGKYVLYYSMSVWGGEQTCGIGRAVADTPTGPYTDLGKLFRSNEIGVQNSIDQFYIEDNGKKYLFWGSFHGIYYVELSDDGLYLKNPSSPNPIAVAGNAFEGTYIHKRGEYYYLFASIGSCCNGLSSTYKLVVGRSTSLTGPYVDKAGKSMKENNANELIIGSNSRFVGNGHCSEIVLDEVGNYWILFHGWDVENAGNGRVLLLNQIKWDDNNWPYADNNSPAITAPKPVFANFPTDNQISTIKPYQSSISLPVFGEHIPHFYGFNQYGVLLDPDVQGVALSCPETLGTIQGNKFIASGQASANTNGNITATCNGNVTATIAVNLFPVSDITIRLDSALLDNRSDYTIEFAASTSAGNANISPTLLTWGVSNGDICRVENGRVKALKNGTTTVTGQMNGITDDLKINVEIPAAPTMIGDSLKVANWTLSASNFLSAQLNQNNLPSTWEHGAGVNFVHSEGRSPFIRLTNQRPFYGLPDTIKIVLNIGDMAISRAIVYLKANNATKTISIEFNTFERNKDFSLNIPVNRLFDTNDRGIYPVWFDNVNFYLETSSMTVGRAYTLAVKDILLVYKDYILSGISTVKTNDFYIYPNPLKGETIYFQLKESNSQVLRTEIYNLSGQLLKTKSHGIYQGGIVPISVKNLISGIYLLKVYDNERFYVSKFMVE